MDCAVVPLGRFKNLSLVQTVDFFYPLVDDPFVMGQIALANVVSDMYAVGLTTIDDLSMIISSPISFSELERDIIIPMIINGFQKAANSINCRVTVRNMVNNPWCIIGGVATSVCSNEEVILPFNAEVGDVLILTKPLGTQMATNAYIWMEEQNDDYRKLSAVFSPDDVTKTFKIALQYMTTLNKNAALLMHKYKAHAATDITGFGLLGHAKNLAAFQKNKVLFRIEKLPIIKNVLQFCSILNLNDKLKSGTSVETSGGLLICLPSAIATEFCNEYAMMSQFKHQAWVVGNVVGAKASNAMLVENPEFIEVD